MSFYKNKIKGISFHHRSHKKSKNQNYRIHDFFNLDELYLQIKKETPSRFSPTDIKRFLCDHGRNEINSRISQCIDFCAKWNGILKLCERCFPDKYFLNQSFLKNSQDELLETIFEDEIEIYLLIKKLIRLWKHNLSILEMTAQAQYFINRH